jgi:hypothetical protein
MSNTLETSYSKWNKWLYLQVDNSALVVFRMIYGLLLAAEAFGSIALGAVKRLFIDVEMTFTFIGFGWMEPLPGNGMYVLYSIMGVAGLMIMLGYRYRMAMLFYAIAWTYVYLLQKSSYNNHCYLIMLLNWLMVLLPAHRSVSLDAKFGYVERREHHGRWINLFIIAFLFIIYSYASIAKFYPDWLDGSFAKYLMSTRGRDFEILQNEWAHQAILYFGLFFDLLIVPLLLWKPTRWPAVIASVFFHLFNSIVFKIGIFPYLALSFLLFFFTSKTVQRRLLPRKNYYDKGEIIVPSHGKFIVFAGSTFLIVMTLLPLRHWIIADDVLWTEEGHRLSWRMMLRSRSGVTSFYVVDKETQKRERVNLNDYLSEKQQRSVQTKPDFIWQFSQKLKEIYADKGQEIQIFVNSRVSINGRPHKEFIDPEVDIAAEDWSHFKHHDWILPSPLYLEE